MNLPGLKDYFLSVMGIPRFILRERSQCNYLLLLSPLEAKPTHAMKALLSRLIDAIHWQKEATQRIGFQQELNKEYIQERVGVFSPQKVIMFGIEFAQTLGLKPKEQIYMLKIPENENAIPCAIVSSLDSLLKDKVAKRRTWELLQRL